MHDQPDSTWQVFEQPSNEIVFMSSHFFIDLTNPSPQFGEQIEGLELQTNPSSILHIAEHPLLERVFRSSQVSCSMIIPSPHTGGQVEGNPEHVQPSSC